LINVGLLMTDERGSSEREKRARDERERHGSEREDRRERGRHSRERSEKEEQVAFAGNEPQRGVLTQAD
jgi:hypothetical protein